jgi:CO/xanthine dehydrogenase Mo-binding subunit
MRTRIGIDRATGKIQAFAADHVLDGGGLANFSSNAGSMRGYGTLQTMTALEVLIDEAASALPLNPIEFRRRNALKPNGRTMTGNPYSVSVRTPEILDKLDMHPIWRQRAEEKARLRSSGTLVGTGLACVTKDYGAGADCSLGRVEIAADSKISIHCDHLEMATASAPRWPTVWPSISAAWPTKCRLHG